MNPIHALFLSVIQGATEFLPVSSSGHLFLVQYFLGISSPNLFFEVLLHMGTLVAVLVFYRNDIAEVVRGFFHASSDFLQRKPTNVVLSHEGIRIALFVVVASIPTAIIGFALNNFLDPARPNAVITAPIVAFILLVNGAMLFSYRWITQRQPQTQPSGKLTLWGFDLKTALIIGIAQGCAVLPGLSRSGSTISTAIFCGVERENAARFSFLISIPAIVGAFLLQLQHIDFTAVPPTQWALYFAYAALAGIVGLLCLRWLVALLRYTRFYLFSYYCWLAGIVAFCLIFVYY